MHNCWETIYPIHHNFCLKLILNATLPKKKSRQQIFTARLYFALEQLRNGTHLLITDVDNVFSRHVPLHGFVDEGYDVYHAYEMWYPTDIASKFGFVICGCHYFLRSSPEAIRFMELVIKKCGWKCDDQVAYNRVFFYDLNVTWDGGIDTPNHVGALRINAPDTENDQLLVESVTGRSSVTNHTIKIWDRDFTWRVSSGGVRSNWSITRW